MIEKRKHPRIPTAINLELFVLGSTISRGRGCVVNMSGGGMAIETDAKLDVGEELFLRVNVPIEIMGRIIRSEEVGLLKKYGIKISNIGFIDKQKLKRYIRSYLKNK